MAKIFGGSNTVSVNEDPKNLLTGPIIIFTARESLGPITLSLSVGVRRYYRNVLSMSTLPPPGLLEASPAMHLTLDVDRPYSRIWAHAQ